MLKSRAMTSDSQFPRFRAYYVRVSAYEPVYTKIVCGASGPFGLCTNYCLSTLISETAEGTVLELVQPAPVIGICTGV